MTTVIQPTPGRTSIQDNLIKPTPNIILPNPIDNDISNRSQDQKKKLKEELDKVSKDLENSNLTKEKRAKLKGKRNSLENRIEELQGSNNNDINMNEINRAINKDIRGVEVYVHGKPYPDYSWMGYKRPENYLHKIQFRVIGKNDPYALVDENLRQLKNYTKNDVLNEYVVDGNGDAQLNIQKKPNNAFNTYMMKKVIILPNDENQSGGKKKYNIKTKRKYSKNKRKTKRKYPKNKRKTKRK